MDLQLQELQSERTNGVPPPTEAIQVLGSPQMNPLEMLECLLSKEELWFEENGSSCQRTLKNHKHERKKEKARNRVTLVCLILRNALVFIGNWMQSNWI